MTVSVMGIRDVRVRMAQRHVAMRVAVRPVRQGGVHMIMVTIVMGVRVFMRHGFMVVCMGMPFHQVQQHTRKHQGTACHQRPGGGTIGHRKGHHTADEGREGEYRARARRAKRPLRQQVKAQAQAITCSAYSQQSDGRAPVWQGFCE